VAQPGKPQAKEAKPYRRFTRMIADENETGL
jgi:hypothetical protein